MRLLYISMQNKLNFKSQAECCMHHNTIIFVAFYCEQMHYGYSIACQINDAMSCERLLVRFPSRKSSLFFPLTLALLQ